MDRQGMRKDLDLSLALAFHLRGKLAAVLLLVITLGFLNLWTNTAFSQQGKNPKVAEVETYLTQQTIQLVKNRFPSVPVLVSLTVSPLRRSQSELTPGFSGEELPYYSLGSTTQILDEWDDPNKAINDLLPRIQSVSIQITMPQFISDDELFELRDTLYSNLHIIPGRDKIEFVRKNWKRESDLSMDWLMLIIGSFVFVALFSTFALRYFVVRLQEGLSKGGGGGEKAPPPPPPQLQGGALGGGRGGPAGKTVVDGGGLQFNDTVKVGEKLLEILERLEENPAFPSLEDMIDLENLAKTDPRFLGTILQEMPKKMQERVFARSSDPAWLEAFFDQAPLEIEHYHFGIKLAYRKRDEEHLAWEDLLISLWRLGDALKPFIQELDQRDALGILAWMPTTISVPTARETFPGGWGILLRHDFRPPPFPDKICEDMRAKCLEIKPHNKMMMLDKYRHERGLLQFLRACTLEEERDIYKASKADASIHVIRPPFYPIFDAADDLLKKLSEMISPHDWGVALFNVDRGMRGKITHHLSDSQNYILIETLKACDHDGISQKDIWKMREKVAKVFHKMQKDLQEGEEHPLHYDEKNPPPKGGENKVA